MSHLSDAELPYRCAQCPKATSTASNLSRHVRGVHGRDNARSNPYKDTFFRTTHENVFPYKCELCEYRGRTLDLLKVHKRSHLAEAERPYRCPHCPKATTSASNLSKHIRHIHKVKGERQGRIPSYLQAQLEGPSDKSAVKVKGDRQGRIAAYLQDQSGAPCDNS
ncbi:Uncharacterized protein OBRU01_10830, partial [Operophtera brumata]